MASDQFFMDFGKLSSDDGFAIADFPLKLAERGLDSVRSFEEDDGFAYGSDPIKPQFSVFSPSWWETKERKKFGR